jgi:hypothetical protein
MTNLTTLFLTKLYLLNTISILRRRKLVLQAWTAKPRKTSIRWLPLGTQISKFWVFGTSSWLKILRETKFQDSSFQGRGCRRDPNLSNDGNGAWQTETILSLKSCFLVIKSPKTWKSAIKKISFFSSLNQYFPHIPYVASKKGFLPPKWDIEKALRMQKKVFEIW